MFFVEVKMPMLWHVKITYGAMEDYEEIHLNILSAKKEDVFAKLCGILEHKKNWKDFAIRTDEEKPSFFITKKCAENWYEQYKDQQEKGFADDIKRYVEQRTYNVYSTYIAEIEQATQFFEIEI